MTIGEFKQQLNDLQKECKIKDDAKINFYIDGGRNGYNCTLTFDSTYEGDDTVMCDIMINDHKTYIEEVITENVDIVTAKVTTALQNSY